MKSLIISMLLAISISNPGIIKPATAEPFNDRGPYYVGSPSLEPSTPTRYNTTLYNQRYREQPSVQQVPSEKGFNNRNGDTVSMLSPPTRYRDADRRRGNCEIATSQGFNDRDNPELICQRNNRGLHSYSLHR